MNSSTFLNRCYQFQAQHLGKRLTNFVANKAVVSFTFDDFPASAYVNGYSLLRNFGYKGTYYISLGLLGNNSNEIGEIASLDILQKIVEEENELGCHTFDHADCWSFTFRNYMESIKKNSERLQDVMHGYTFQTFSYPMGRATLKVKKNIGKRFLCARGTSGGLNKYSIDRNLLQSNAVYGGDDNCARIADLMNIIDSACRMKGWLILHTHDIDSRPSRYGCTPVFFNKVIEYVAKADAEVLTVAQVAKKYLAEQ